MNLKDTVVTFDAMFRTLTLMDPGTFVKSAEIAPKKAK
jgi:hypothetical protein